MLILIILHITYAHRILMNLQKLGKHFIYSNFSFTILKKPKQDYDIRQYFTQSILLTRLSFTGFTTIQGMAHKKNPFGNSSNPLQSPYKKHPENYSAYVYTPYVSIIRLSLVIFQFHTSRSYHYPMQKLPFSLPVDVIFAPDGKRFG